MYVLMKTASVLVEDAPTAVERLRESIGLPEPRPQSYVTGPGVSAVFCRVHPKYAVAPTFLEVIAPGPAHGDEHVFPIAQIAALQGDRVVKNHATEIGMSEETLADLATHLEGLGVPLGFAPPDRRDRFFVGGDPTLSYDRSADAGLFVEAGSTTRLGLPADAYTAPADVPSDARPETMVRIVARDYLVDDLEEAVATIKQNLRWEPVTIDDEVGERRAVFQFSMPRSARLELVQATGRGRAADAYDKLGPGAWTVRVAVVDVRAKADDLQHRDTPFTLEGGTLRVDPAATLEVPFEFVAA